MGMAEWGYSVLEGSPSEQFTTSGAEATVKYIGPSQYRVPFIMEVFGAWHVDQRTVTVQEDPAITRLVKCAVMYPEVTAYPYLTVLDDEAQCTGAVCLWPDTFSGQPSGDSKPYLLNCGAGSDLGWPILDQCAWEYSVNYRYKNNGSLPDILKTDKPTSLVPQPAIPFGTYTSAKITTSSEYMTTPGRMWKYEPNLFNPAPADSWDFCADCSGKSQLLKIEDDAISTTEISKLDIELIWDNVPLPPWDIIRAANGCVNSHPIFGFPIGSVMFEFGEPEITGYFGCMEVYRLRYIFKVKTAAVKTTALYEQAPFGEFLDGQVGIWNRRWCPCPVTYAGLSNTAICSNWVPIKQMVDPEDQCNCSYAPTEQSMFPSYPLQLLFAMNVCNCTPADEPGGCVNNFGVLKVKSLYPDTPEQQLANGWEVHGVSQVTATALLGNGLQGQFNEYT
jgi:hypothetical protein